jgi:nucleolin
VADEDLETEDVEVDEVGGRGGFQTIEGRGGSRGGRGASTNRGGFGDFKGKKQTF